MTPPPNPPMVWCRGRVTPLAELCIPASDRVFEHGLGLFESMRSQDEKVPLWPRHLNRLTRSVRDLGLSLHESHLPTIDDFRTLLKSSGLVSGPARLRLVATGGSVESAGEVFVTAAPLDLGSNRGMILADDFWPVDVRDDLIQYKTLNYWHRRRAFEKAVSAGAEDALSIDNEGMIWEASRSALFLVVDGRWIAPPAEGPYLKSVAASVTEELLRESMRVELIRRPISKELLASAQEIVLANAVRGPMSVAQWSNVRYDHPGPAFTALETAWRSSFF